MPVRHYITHLPLLIRIPSRFRHKSEQYQMTGGRGMKSEGFALITVIALLAVTTSANAAPYRHLLEVTDSLPRSQWFINSSGEIVDDAHFEFYDNPSAAGFPDYP